MSDLFAQLDAAIAEARLNSPMEAQVAAITGDLVGAIAYATDPENSHVLYHWLTEEECFEPVVVAGWLITPLTSDPDDADSEDEDWVGFRFEKPEADLNVTLTPDQIEHLIFGISCYA